jgi:hypothetical protein
MHKERGVHLSKKSEFLKSFSSNLCTRIVWKFLLFLLWLKEARKCSPTTCKFSPIFEESYSISDTMFKFKQRKPFTKDSIHTQRKYGVVHLFSTFT